MENTEKSRFGLVGKNISYSFSKGFFTQKFKELGLNHHCYENFDLAAIEDFQDLIKQNKNLKGLNVTIPYKELVIPYLDKLNPKAKKIGAVNTIKFTKKGLKGFNTDIYGFKKSIKPFLKKRHKKALILGTGGASKAVAFSFAVKAPSTPNDIPEFVRPVSLAAPSIEVFFGESTKSPSISPCGRAPMRRE